MAAISERMVQAKDADDQLTYLVFGFIKSIQNSHDSLSIIPIDIFYLCIVFLFQPEYFNIMGDGIDVSEDRMTITKSKESIGSWDNTSYGKISILSTSERIVTWKVKMNKCNPMNTRCIGIVSTIDCQNTDWIYNDVGFYYGFSENGVSVGNRKNTEDAAFLISCADTNYGPGDTVTIILNLKDATISFGSTSDPVIVWRNIKIDEKVSYSFAATIYQPEVSMTIIDFNVEEKHKTQSSPIL